MNTNVCDLFFESYRLLRRNKQKSLSRISLALLVEGQKIVFTKTILFVVDWTISHKQECLLRKLTFLQHYRAKKAEDDIDRHSSLLYRRSRNNNSRPNPHFKIHRICTFKFFFFSSVITREQHTQCRFNRKHHFWTNVSTFLRIFLFASSDGRERK